MNLASVFKSICPKTEQVIKSTFHWAPPTWTAVAQFTENQKWGFISHLFLTGTPTFSKINDESHQSDENQWGFKNHSPKTCNICITLFSNEIQWDLESFSKTCKLEFFRILILNDEIKWGF